MNQIKDVERSTAITCARELFQRYPPVYIEATV
jgi:hypothetical protein